jgi:hypothetical protein
MYSISYGSNTFIIDTSSVLRTSIDSRDPVEHFRSYLKIENGDDDQIVEFNSVDEKFFLNHKIDSIQSFDGNEYKSIENNESDRLKRYLEIGMQSIREEINIKNRHGTYDLYSPFDCQRFASYLQIGKEDKKYALNQVYSESIARDSADPNEVKSCVYEILATADTFGKNGVYSVEDMSVHYFMYLGNGIVVSKFGSRGVFFTSFSSALSSYWPKGYSKCELKYHYNIIKYF